MDNKEVGLWAEVEVRMSLDTKLSCANGKDAVSNRTREDSLGRITVAVHGRKQVYQK